MKITGKLHWFKKLIRYPLKGKMYVAISFVLGLSLNFIVLKIMGHFEKGRQLASLEKEVEDSEKNIPITTAVVVKRTLADVFSLHGNLVPMQEVAVSADSRVSVDEIYVHWGQKVQKGQPIFRVSSRSHQIQQQLNQIEDSLKTSDFNTMAKLMKKEIISKNEYQQKELEFKSQSLRRELEKVESGAGIISSPISGVVAEIKMKVGDYIDQPGKYFIKIVDGSELKFESFLPLDIAGRLQEGKSVELVYEKQSLDIKDNKDKEKERDKDKDKEKDKSPRSGADTALGIIEGISPVVDSSSGTVLVSVFLKKIKDGWRPGIYVKANFTLDKKENVLAIKNESVLYEKGHPYTYTVVEDEEKKGVRGVQRAALELGITDGIYTEIKSGLNENDIVADQGIGTLSDNSQVEIFNY